jgi:thymidylate synthase (FAD)
MFIEYIEHMGDDAAVADAARVSFGKRVTKFEEKDAKLIQYLAKHNHWSPFAHCFIKFRVMAPIFVARQLMKHQVGFSWNEVSRRYITDMPSLWNPIGFRKAPEGSIKQGSSNEFVSNSYELLVDFNAVAKSCFSLYNKMIADGVCPEQARAILPQGTMTEWIWTGSLYAWARMATLRLDSHSQAETQEIAEGVDLVARQLFPHSWKALMKYDG